MSSSTVWSWGRYHLSFSLRRSNKALSPGSSPDAISVVPAATRLSDDVLYEIFLQLADLPVPVDERARTGKRQHSWFVTTQVCRRWRSVALNAARLWSTIQVDLKCNLEFLDLFIQRSKNAPLKVAFLGWSRSESLERKPLNADCIARISAAADILAGQTQRIVEFLVGKYTTSEMSVILSPFTHPAPHLRVLHIHRHARSTTPMAHDFLFNGQIPRLQQLRLESTITSHSWSSYSGLTSLVLKGQKPLPVSRLLSMLIACPELQKFTLAAKRLVRDNTLELLLASLPLLESLDIKLRKKDMEAILGHVRFPTSTRVRLRIQHDSHQIMSLSHLCPPLRNLIDHMEDASLEIYSKDTLVALTSSDGTFRVEGFTYVTSAGLAFPSLKRLTVVFAEGKPSWAHIFARMPQLTAIIIDAMDGLQPNMLRALSKQYRVATGKTLLCPDLKVFLVPRFAAYDRDHVIPLVEKCFRSRAKLGAFVEEFDVAFYIWPSRAFHERCCRETIGALEALKTSVRSLCAA